jgi:hypothetical protein
VVVVGEYAPEGFYVDNRGSIFWWHLDGRVWVWEFIGPCEPPPSCDTLLLGYTDGRELPPTAACSADPMPYELDPLTNILYREGGCGDERCISAWWILFGWRNDIFNWARRHIYRSKTVRRITRDNVCRYYLDN